MANFSKSFFDKKGSVGVVKIVSEMVIVHKCNMDVQGKEKWCGESWTQQAHYSVMTSRPINQKSSFASL